MKSKILIILVVLILVGCSENTKEKINSDEFRYTLTSISKQKLDDENTRLYAVLENTSKNNVIITSANLVFTDKKTNKIIYKQEKKYKHGFNAGESMLLTFDLTKENNKSNVNVYVELTYDYKFKNYFQLIIDKVNYNRIQTVVSDKTNEIVDNKSIITLTTYYIEETKINKLKIITYNSEDKPTCISYLNLNKTVKPDKRYSYKIECDADINIDGRIVFETQK